MNPSTTSTSCTAGPSSSNVQRFTMNFTDISSNNTNPGQQINLHNSQVNRSAFVPIARSNFNEEMMDVSSGLPPV